ncbi:MAG: carboxy-S-adenosyl-L-methionine synthase CmoA [Gammaproteobacteria bacterium]|jgi:tRNA (cmo5U34)-methyltransferase|nr:carboxy-S-adenosyl-L-methionine synthase CmoA [Gammaproteobacteria bacterium]
MSDLPYDRLYAGHEAPRGDFVFDERVVRVFSDMLARSVPGWSELIRLVGLIGARLAQPGSRVYDLGCSLGASSASILARLSSSVEDDSVCIWAVDNAPAMLRELEERLAEAIAAGRLRPLCADVGEIAIEDASVVLLNLTLQFIAPDQRLALLRRIRVGLRAGGGLILVEKVALPEADPLLAELHRDFKAAQGYSALEIARKRAALEQVLIPDDEPTHIARLHEAGFERVERFFQCLNFVGWIAR